MKTRMIQAAIVVWAAVLMVGLASGQSGDSITPKLDNSVYAELKKAPAKAATRQNPLESDPDAIAGGAKLFRRHCAECHGASAEGAKKGPSLRELEVQQSTPGTLFWVLSNGVVRRGMPVWSRLPEPQRWQLVSYIKSLGASDKTPSQ